jgi:NAD dependent epimerase/dehydratase family enzyme
MIQRVAVVGGTGQIGRPPCTGHLESADAVVYLAGAPLSGGRPHSRAGIEAESRARAAALGPLVAALGGLSRRPGVLVAASSVGYYGYADRTAALRTGYVLVPGRLAAQVAQFRRHVGGWIGTGRGWTPWLHVADEVGIILFALQQPAASGPTPVVRLGLGVVTDAAR